MSKWKLGDPTFLDEYPRQSSEWHNFLNRGVRPDQIPPRCGKYFWWRCFLGHEWKATAANRKTTNCPFCSGNKHLLGFNDLYTKRPDLAHEWHPTKNGKLTPFDVMSSVALKVWWICSLGHEYPAKISNRNTGYGCPYCSGNKVLLGFNDLVTTCFEIAQQWHPTKNRGRRPEQYSRGSTYRAWWLCENGHDWDIEIYHRTGHNGEGRGCPKCGRGISKEETDVYEALRIFYPNLRSHVSLPVPHGKGTRALVDMYLEAADLRLVIEYDGSYWHADKMRADRGKTTALIEKGYKVLRLRERPLSDLKILHPNYRVFEFPLGADKKLLGQPVSEIVKLIIG